MTDKKKGEGDESGFDARAWARKHTPQQLELNKIRQQLSTAQAAEKAALALLSNYEEKLSVALALSDPQPLPVIKPRSKSKRVREATAVLHCSDWHVEKRIRPETVDGLNAHDLEIGQARTEELWRGVEWNIKALSTGSTRYTIKDMVIWLGGDLINNYLHDEDKEENLLSPTEALLLMIQRVRQGIDFFLANLDVSITIFCSYGNHGRTNVEGRPKHATGAKNSFEWLAYHLLKLLYADEPRVSFVISDGLLLRTKIYDWHIAWHHGDDIKYYGGISGLYPNLQKALDAWREAGPIDVLNIGHYHQFQNFRDAVVNDCLCGYDSYAMSKKFRYAPPGQAFYLIDKERGKRHAVKIYVDDQGKRI